MTLLSRRVMPTSTRPRCATIYAGGSHSSGLILLKLRIRATFYLGRWQANLVPYLPCNVPTAVGFATSLRGRSMIRCSGAFSLAGRASCRITVRFTHSLAQQNPMNIRVEAARTAAKLPSFTVSPPQS